MSETATEIEKVKPTLTVIDPTQLGQGLYTEEVTVNPNVDGNTPAKPLDEAIFDERGVETGKIVYIAQVLAPRPGSTDNFGNTRNLVVRGEGKKSRGEHAGEPYSFLKLDVDVKIVSFAYPDENHNEKNIRGRSGKFQDAQLFSFVRDVDGQPYSELLDFAVKMGLVNPQRDQTAAKVDLDALTGLIANHILTGNAQIACTVKWHGGYNKAIKDSEGKTTTKSNWDVIGQKNFPVVNGTHTSVINTNGRETRAIVKLDEFRKLPA